MSALWRPSTSLFCGHPCIEHRVTKELALVGRHGEIWLYNNKNQYAVIYNARIAKRYLPAELHPIKLGDEVLLRFPINELPIWLKRLGVPIKAAAQIKFNEQRIKINSKLIIRDESL